VTSEGQCRLLFAFCRARKPELDQICERVAAYAGRLPL